MENKLKSFFNMYWYLRRTFSKTGPKPPKKRERERNIRICSPSLALKMWSSKKKVLLLVLSGANMCAAPCDPSLWTWPLSFLYLTLTHRTVNHLQVPWWCHWAMHLTGGDQFQTSISRPTEADQRLTLLHFWYSSSCVVSIPKCGVTLRNAVHSLTTKGIVSNHLLSPNSWTVTKL